MNSNFFLTTPFFIKNNDFLPGLKYSWNSVRRSGGEIFTAFSYFFDLLRPGNLELFFRIIFRITKKPSYDVIFCKFCLDYDVIINLVTRFFLVPLLFRVVFRILTRKTLFSLIFSSYLLL